MTINLQISRKTAIMGTLSETFKDKIFIKTENGTFASLKYDDSYSIPFKIDKTPKYILPPRHYALCISEDEYLKYNRSLDDMENIIINDLYTKKAPFPEIRMCREQGVIELLLDENKTFKFCDSFAPKETRIRYNKNGFESPFEIIKSDGTTEPLQGFWEFEAWKQAPLITTKLDKYKVKDELGIYETMGTQKWIEGLNVVS